MDVIAEKADVDFQLLLDSISMKYGYDFQGYARASMRRRMDAILLRFQLADYTALMARLIREDEFFRAILPFLTVTTTEMFRDPVFFRSLREKVLPELRTFPSLNIWVAGSSHGQEAYSLAIMLHEEGLLDRSVIFATDINPAALKSAREGIFPIESLQLYTKNYLESGGTAAFSDYYTADYGFARMATFLKDNMVFSEHNLGTDGVFTECQLILCRNVLIYFDKNLQNKVLKLFRNSLRFRGFLALGSKENLRFSDQATAFDVVDAKNKIYLKREGTWS